MLGIRIYLFCILAGTVLLAGCTKDCDKAIAIEFESSTIGASVESKAEKNSFSNGDRIGLFAFHLPPGVLWSGSSRADFMYNQELELSSGKWVYSPVKYWPSNEGARLRFYAYYPYDKPQITDISSYVSGVPSFEFRSDNNTDLLVTSAIEMESPEDNAPVKLDMQHALSQVSFVGKLSKGGVAHIKKIKLYGATSVGIYTFPEEQGKKGTWSGDAVNNANDIEKSSNANDGAGALIDSDADYRNLDEFATMLIPLGEIDKIGVWINNEEEQVKDDLNIKLEQGKKYTLKIIVNLEEIILVTSSITDWVLGGTADETVIR